MIRPIMTKRFFLSKPCEDATADDAQVVRDLVDTLEEFRLVCKGMAANMIGERKRIIAVFDENESMIVMVNPRLTLAQGAYEAEERCLCFEDSQLATRYRRIQVEYLDASFKRRERTFEGVVAQAIQHEMDHCDGVLI